MVKKLAKRMGLLLLTLLLVTVLAFLAFSIIPGDPTSSILGVDATPEQVAVLREQLGLDLPIWQRYWNWLSQAFAGDLGTSYNFRMPVGQLMAPKMSATLLLAALSFVLIVVISIPLGILSARHAGGWLDRVDKIPRRPCIEQCTAGFF